MKMTGRSFIIILLIFMIFRGFGQDSSLPSWYHEKPKNLFALSTGINQVQEENLIGMVNKGTIVRFSYGRERTAKHLTTFNLCFDYSRVRTGYEEVSKSVNLGLRLGYDYSFHIVKAKKFDYLLGPEARINYSASYLPNWDESHLYWSDYFSLGVKNHLVFTLHNQNLIWARVSLPVIAVASRPELNRQYKIDELGFGDVLSNMNSNLEPGSWDIFFYFDMQVEYRFKISDKVFQSVYYTFDYVTVHTNYNNRYQQLAHLIGLKIYF